MKISQSTCQPVTAYASLTNMVIDRIVCQRVWEQCRQQFFKWTFLLSQIWPSPSKSSRLLPHLSSCAPKIFSLQAIFVIILPAATYADKDSFHNWLVQATSPAVWGNPHLHHTIPYHTIIVLLYHTIMVLPYQTGRTPIRYLSSSHQGKRNS